MNIDMKSNMKYKSRIEKQRVYIDNMHFYAAMRFKQLTLLLAWLSFVGITLTKINFPQVNNLKLYLLFLSSIVVIVIWFMEISSSVCWFSNKIKCPSLMPGLGDSLNKFVRITGLFNSTNAVAVFYLTIYIFHLILILTWEKSTLFFGIGCILGSITLLVNMVTYWPMVRYHSRITKK